MNKTFGLVLLLLVMPLSFLAADIDVIDYDVEVSADANLVLAGGPYTDAYWIETDETGGVIVLRFRDERLAELQPCEAPFLETFRMSLEITVPDIGDAESTDGLVIFHNGLEIGRLGEVSRGTSVAVPLDVFAVSPAEELLFIVRGAGPDGLAIASKNSGAGAKLRVVVFPETRYDDFPVSEEEMEPE